MSVTHQPFDEGVLLRPGVGDVLRERGTEAGARQPIELFEAAADPGKGAEQVVHDGPPRSRRASR